MDLRKNLLPPNVGSAQKFPFDLSGSSITSTIWRFDYSSGLVRRALSIGDVYYQVVASQKFLIFSQMYVTASFSHLLVKGYEKRSRAWDKSSNPEFYEFIHRSSIYQRFQVCVLCTILSVFSNSVKRTERREFGPAAYGVFLAKHVKACRGVRGKSSTVRINDNKWRYPKRGRH